jgi:uncharacterized membrane protein YgdD (TMEM256/DUF423 family)
MTMAQGATEMRGPLAALLALAGALAVVAGAYGAHGATGEAAAWLDTGATYLMVHAVVGLVALQADRRGAAALFLGGGLLFAGTLFAMALGGPRWLGAITPIGGLGLILGWLWLAASLLRGR